jgi:2-polyprenyl-6-methoxyphenol hydroxylase-like FAD-dependent oxidoreductase
MKFVNCNKIATGRIIFIGDAAHAMSANVGMGCNSALGDASVLAEAALAAEGDLDCIGEVYNELRLEDARALVRLSERLGAFQQFAHVKDVGRRMRAVLFGTPIMVTTACGLLPLPGLFAVSRSAFSCLFFGFVYISVVRGKF